MWAFIVAGLIFVGFTLFAMLLSYANGMRTAPQAETGALQVFLWGVVIAGIVALTHWMPHLGW